MEHGSHFSAGSLGDVETVMKFSIRLSFESLSNVIHNGDRCPLYLILKSEVSACMKGSINLDRQVPGFLPGNDILKSSECQNILYVLKSHLFGCQLYSSPSADS